MKKMLVLAVITGCLFGCGVNDKHKNKLTVTGTIVNTDAKMIYLEEVPVGSMSPVVVDSAAIKDGKFSLTAEPTEAVILNLHLDRNTFPVVSLINDTARIGLTITMSAEDNRFAEKYEVTGSPASQQMRDFVIGMTKGLQDMYHDIRQADNLQRKGLPDSVWRGYVESKRTKGAALRAYALGAIDKAGNPALAVFELTYYLSAAGSQAYELEPVSNEEIHTIINAIAARFPRHSALAALKNSIDNMPALEEASSMLGKVAPDFSLPDANGKQVNLSSFRGKYVLIDFWASWCKPCRMENPNVVKAFTEFRNKNFTILGVSFDKEKAPWIKAVMDDKLTWPQVSDLQYWDSPVIAQYGINSIPYNVLLDPSGVVIAEGLRGEGLRRKLAEVLQ